MLKKIYQNTRIFISRLTGHIQGMYGFNYYIDPITIKQSMIIQDIYEYIHGHDEIDPTNPISMVEFVEQHSQLKEALSILMMADQARMRTYTESSMPQSIYSYAYVATSILLDPTVEADLTYGLSEVSEDEYNTYYRELMNVPI
jgi:hypothetical protein